MTPIFMDIQYPVTHSKYSILICHYKYFIRMLLSS